MAVMVPIRATVQPGWPSGRPEMEALPSNLVEWRPEQLWLSTACWDGPAQQAMADAVSTALVSALKGEAAASPQCELLLVLRYMRREAAWLRLAARVLRGPSSTATAHVRNLAASALWVAAMRHSDLLATIEFGAEVTGHAVMLEADLVPGHGALPPGMETMAQVASRMRRRGRELLAHRLTWPDLDTIIPSLDRALAEDPLRGLGKLTPVGGA